MHEIELPSREALSPTGRAGFVHVSPDQVMTYPGLPVASGPTRTQ